MRADLGAVCRIGDIPAEDVGLPGLDLAGAGNDGEQRRLADAVGSDQPNHAPGRKSECDAVEGRGLAVTLSDVLDAPDSRPGRRSGGATFSGHCVIGVGMLGGALGCRLVGQATEGSVRT